MMKRILIIFTIVLSGVVINASLNIYDIYCYEKERYEWQECFRENEKHFSYVVETLTKPSVSEDIYHIELSKGINIKCSENVKESISKDDILLEALDEIKATGVEIILVHDVYYGCEFLKNEKAEYQEGFHNIGICYTQEFAEYNTELINHIEGNWFFKNTKYNLRKEKRIYRGIYNLLFE